MSSFLSRRHEFLFAYDVRMSNPNGDPDENRPRVLPDGTYYITDVRLKRFIRDQLKNQGHEILVDDIEGRTTNLTGRVGAYLQKAGKAKADGAELVDIILDTFIDARLFGSSLAFAETGKKGSDDYWRPAPVPKTLTGTVQIKHGEALHRCHEAWIRGTTTFSSQEEKSQGTFTEVYVLRYGLFGFNGIANEHNARKSRATDADYDLMLKAMWTGVRSAANTRSKAGQSPRLLVDISYRPGSEFQFGRLLDYVKLIPVDREKEETEWSGPQDYVVDLTKMVERINQAEKHIERVALYVSPDLLVTQATQDWMLSHGNLDIDELAI